MSKWKISCTLINATKKSCWNSILYQIAIALAPALTWRRGAKDERDAREHIVRAAAQTAQHVEGVRVVARLLEDAAVADDDRVAADDEVERRRGRGGGRGKGGVVR